MAIHFSALVLLACLSFDINVNTEVFFLFRGSAFDHDLVSMFTRQLHSYLILIELKYIPTLFSRSSARIRKAEFELLFTYSQCVNLSYSLDSSYIGTSRRVRVYHVFLADFFGISQTTTFTITRIARPPTMGQLSCYFRFYTHPGP